ncbi:MAG: CoA ester lyase [Gammaproteobacteria bacterium]|uniref:HpcH/HpaI aldolase/citrate lyase family protein n=1 Tax=Bradyrhizobium sp. TaxID=376 RepID=UPI003D14AFE4
MTTITMRSLLAVPAVRPEFFVKAAASATDALFLDLEDSVPPPQKLAARANAAAALDEVDWGGKRVLVRTNALDSEWAFRDIEQLGARCRRLDGFLVPKVGAVDEIRHVEALLTALDRERPPERPLELHILIETALGMARVEAILEASTRLVSVSFGVGDYSLSMGGQDRLVGGANRHYAMLTDAAPDAPSESARQSHWNDQWHFALARVANACHAFDVMPIDGPFGNFSDPEGFNAAATRGRVLGYAGKWAIHPSQVALANQAYTPGADEVTWARAVLKALADSQREGKGAVAMNGQLLDIAHEKIARRILARAGISQDGAARDT